MFRHKFHEDFVMQTQTILLYIYFWLVYLKKQNVHEMGDVLPFVKCAFYQRIVKRRCHATNFPNALRILKTLKQKTNPAALKPQISSTICATTESILLLNYIIEPRHEISNNVVCATSKGSDQPAHTRCLIRTFASRLKIL